MKFQKQLCDFYYKTFEKIACNFDFLSNKYLMKYYSIVKSEIEMIKLNYEPRILVIGCGSIPATAIFLSSITRAKTTAIDIDKFAVKKAKNYIEKKKINKLIDIKYSNGLDFKVDDYNIIFITYGVNNKNYMIKKLYSSIPDNCKLVIRYGKKVDKIRIEDLHKYADFQVTKSIYYNGLGNLNSVLLEKII